MVFVVMVLVEHASLHAVLPVGAGPWPEREWGREASQNAIQVACVLVARNDTRILCQRTRLLTARDPACDPGPGTRFYRIWVMLSLARLC